MSEPLAHKSSLLVGALAIAVIVAFARGRGDEGDVLSPDATTTPALGSVVTAPGAASAIAGTVAERLDVPPYSYLRLAQPNGSELWVAVPGTQVGIGETVSVAEPHLMLDFTSSSLGRTFDRIFFGSLDHESDGPEDGAEPGAEPPGMPGDPVPLAPRDTPDPHLNPSAGGESFDAVVPRAEGTTGRTIAEMYDQRGVLAGGTVRVRGVVTRAVSGVLGRTFVHLRDGSGEAGLGTHDLTVTTVEVPEPGQTLLYEGRLTLDRDFGSGYRYPVILEDARSVAE